MHANNHTLTLTHNNNNIAQQSPSILTQSLILPNSLILSTSSVPIPLLNKIANPATHALFALGILAKDRLAVLHFNSRGVDVEIGHVGVDVGAVNSVVAEAERRHGRARVAEEGLCFGESLGGGRHGGCVAEERVHVFQAHVGGFWIDEPD